MGIWAYSSRHTGQNLVQNQAEIPRRLYLRSISVDHPRLAPRLDHKSDQHLAQTVQAKELCQPASAK